MAITFSRWTACGAAALVLLLNGFALPARADDAETFYRGKTIELYVGFLSARDMTSAAVCWRAIWGDTFRATRASS